jgi:hypothetical protein
LAKKINRLGDGPRADDVYNEYLWLMEAKKEFESVLIEALKGE